MGIRDVNSDCGAGAQAAMRTLTPLQWVHSWTSWAFFRALLRSWVFRMMLLGVVLAVLQTAVVYAHADLRQASPEPGATVMGSPEEIRLLFNEPIRPEGSSITLFGDGFRSVTGVTMMNGGDDPALLVATVPDLEPGNYTVQWTAVSADGHPITGSYAFTVATFFVAWQQVGIGVMAVLLLVFLLRLYRVRQQ